MKGDDMAYYTSNLEPGDQVFIDDDESIKATVLGLIFRDKHAGPDEVQVGWMHCGDAKVAWLALRRVRHTTAAAAKAAEDDVGF